MIDFEKARAMMVDCQIRPSDVTDHRVIGAFMAVAREEFVPASLRELAYIDEDILVQSGEPPRYLMEPMVTAKLVHLADVTDECIVLDVGCTTGYSTAILSLLGNSVVALEYDEDLAERATNNLVSQGYDNTAVVQGPLENGWKKEAPYDIIFVGGAVDRMPEVYGEQLREGGRIVVVEGRGNAGVARLYVKRDGVVSGRDVFNCAVKLLPGLEAKEEFVF